MNFSIRPPAVPLVTVDPYFNVWSMADHLYDDFTKHWTGANHGMTGIARIDGKPFIFMGKIQGEDVSDLSQCSVMEQAGLEVKSLSSIYTFEKNGITLKVEFTTPLFLDDLDVLSRPASYITFYVQSNDGRSHDVKIYFDATAEWSINTIDQKVVWGHKRNNKMDVMYIGNEEQNILNASGDDIRIDWGYFYLVVLNNYKTSAVIHSHQIRQDFINGGTIPNIDDSDMPRAVKDNMPVMACTIDFGQVANEQVSTFIILAYDDIKAVEYFHKQRPAYWQRSGMTFKQMLVAAADEYPVILEKCHSFSNELIKEATKVGGQQYADMIGLAYRQAIASHKLVEDEEGNILFFSKECFSNGCMGTVDVSYPSIPLFLLYNSELVKGMLRPVFKYAGTDNWPYDFAPHDVGRYPKANGQVYSTNKETGELMVQRQMPVEECGNMLIMTAAVCMVDKDAHFAEDYWKSLTQWANYLKDYGLDPGDQLCTDDFAGHLAHNTNLSIKAILGIASYSALCKMLGRQQDADQHMTIAKQMAKTWEKMADDGDHYRLTFDGTGTWSQKYNLIWDELMDFHLFSPQVVHKEIAYYLKKQNQYGLPLDSRKDYTKTDWLIWSASMSSSKEEFEKFIKPLCDFLNETPCRVPFTDWYDTVTAMQTNCKCHQNRKGFRNRTVIGGIFIKLLKEKKIL